MTESIWLAIITGLPATLVALAGLVTSMKGRAKLAAQQETMHNENTAAISQNKEAVKKLDDHLNGNLDRLISAAVKAAIANERLEAATKKDKGEA